MENVSVKTITELDNGSLSIHCFSDLKGGTTRGVQYGRQYNHYAAIDERGIFPIGYHLPSSVEWQELIDFCGGFAAAHVALRSTDLWIPQSGSVNGTDLFGFKAKPAGTWEAQGYMTVFRASDDVVGHPERNKAFFLSNYGPYATNTWVCMISDMNRSTTFSSIRGIKDNSDWSQGEKTYDFDGNIYDTIKIGNQVWLVQNLATTHYNNGDVINYESNNLSVGCYYNYQNSEANVFFGTNEPLNTKPNVYFSEVLLSNSKQINGVTGIEGELILLTEANIPKQINKEGELLFTLKEPDTNSYVVNKECELIYNPQP